MRLLRLEISGFKSFCDKAVLSFVQDGVSIVVGPNGCGKSNLVDAIRWALGEQSAKHLRGSSMEDVIFGGSSVRQPVSMAQVTLVFSNPEHDTIPKYSQFTEIAVSRRLYRSGESQYLINKTACRLTDIRELFMDTGIGGKGYSIIEQGKIDRIVTSRPEERREFIDEAAGIVKFKAKRREAERKFAASKQNLLRVEDIIAELSRQEETLREQVAQAEVYLSRKGRLERLQQCTAATRWHRLIEEGRRIDETLGKNRVSNEQSETVIETLEVQEATLKLNLSGKQAKQEDLQRSLQENKESIIKLESKLDTDRAAIENLDEWQKKGVEEAELIGRQIEMINFQVESQRTDAERFEKTSVELEVRRRQLNELEKIKQRELADKQSHLEENQSKELDMAKQLNNDQNRLNQYREKLEELKKSEQQTAEQLENTAKEGEVFKKYLEERQNKLEERQKAKKLCQGRIEASQEVIENQEAVVDSFKEELEDLNRSLNQARDRQQSLRDLLQSRESFDSTTRDFLDYLDQHPEQSKTIGFVGTLAEMVAPPSEEFPQALAFLNRYFNLLVFSSVDQLQQIVGIVDELELEQLQMFFMDLVDDSSGKPEKDNGRWIRRRAEQSGPVPLADSFQSVDVPLFELGAAALKQAGGVVDPQANLMTRAKIFLLGKPGKNNQAELFFKQHEELEQLDHKMKKLQGEKKKTEVRLEHELAVFKEHTQNLERYRKEMIDLDLEILGLEKELSAEKVEQERLAKGRESMNQRLEEIRKSSVALTEQMGDLSRVIDEGTKKQQEVQEEIRRLKTIIEEANLDKQEQTEELQRLQINLASLEEKKKNNRQMIERMEGDRQQRKEQLEEIKKRSVETKERKTAILYSIQQTNEALPKQLQLLGDIEKRMSRMADEIETDRTRLQEIQTTAQKEQKKRNSLVERNHKLEVQLAQLKQEAKNIEDNLYTENRVTPEELLATFDVTKFNIEAEAKTILELKQEIGRMDDVNLAAKKEYDMLKERLDFLTTQSADLEQSIEALENSISKINQESRKRFRESFQLINQHFNRLFPQLFGGGEAYLELTDESDLLESGVEIIAKPPGKKLQNMTLLSGGEKALTAIALIFAVFQIKPSPFCLLDEVDAPLDEANNERFNRHVKLLTENSQFIIITHNKKTMEIGDALFGVTMEEPGISKIVSVDFNTFEMDSTANAPLA